MEKTTAVIKELKPGNFVLIGGVPCRVEKVTVSTSGKHGAAKARLDAVGLFDERRRSIVKPADETVEVPIVNKKTAQVLALMGERVQLMDLTDYSVFELEIPEELRGKLEEGKEVPYYEVVGIRTLKPIK